MPRDGNSLITFKLTVFSISDLCDTRILIEEFLFHSQCMACDRCYILNMCSYSYSSRFAALEKPTTVLPPAMQEAIMAEMEGKQQRKGGLLGLSSKKSKSKGEMEMGHAVNHEPVAELALSHRQLTSPHTKTQKDLKPRLESGRGIGQNGVEQNGIGHNGVTNTMDNILATPQGVNVDFDTDSNLSTGESSFPLVWFSILS